MHYDNQKCFINLRNTLSILYKRVPNGYAMRPGNCPGNDFGDVDIHESLTECAERCNNTPSYLSFNPEGREFSLKTRTCANPIIKNPNDLFYEFYCYKSQLVMPSDLAIALETTSGSSTPDQLLWKSVLDAAVATLPVFRLCCIMAMTLTLNCNSVRFSIKVIIQAGFYSGYLRGGGFPPPPQIPSFRPPKILSSLQYKSNYVEKIIRTRRGQCT